MIRTERLVLRPYRTADAPALVELLGDFRISRWLARVPYPYTLRDAKAWIRISKTEGRYAFAITRDGVLVGSIGLGKRPDGLHELGYWIGRRHHRKGYAEEAARGVLLHAFTELRLRRILVSALPNNKASLALIKKLGFRALGEQRFYATPVRPWPAKIPYFDLRPADFIRPPPRRRTSGSGSPRPGTSRRPARKR